jgi:folate-binding protein YgfZ
MPPAVTLSLVEQLHALQHGAGARSLDDLAVVAVRGADRASWLNGMVTQDVRALAPGRGVYAVAVGVKGKILSDLWVHPLVDDDALALVLPATRCDELIAHLDRYLVMEDVTLERLSGWSVVSVQGPAAERVTEGLRASFADRLGRGGVDLLVEGARRETVIAALQQKVSWVSPEAWEVARLESGRAAYGVDFDGSHFVQEAGLTARAVSFHKGCYLGQEMVCRLEMRGQVQKHLVSLVLEGPAPTVGAEVLAGDKPVGAVTSAAASVSLPGRAVAQAMVRRAAVEAGEALTVAGAPAAVVPRPVP